MYIFPKGRYQRYHVVRRGRKPGIYPLWEMAEEQVKGFSGAVYRSFNHPLLAEHFYRTGKVPEDIGEFLAAFARKHMSKLALGGSRT